MFDRLKDKRSLRRFGRPFGWLKDKRSLRRFGRLFGWFALALVLLSILTGYGITNFKIVDPLTAGFLGKAVSQRWHGLVGVLVLAALAIHVGIALWWRWKGAREPEGEAQE